MLFEDLREIMEFDPIISELWMQEYEFKFRRWKEPREFLVYLYDCIDSRFSD